MFEKQNMNEEENTESRFEGEMTRMMNLVILKLDGLEKDMSEVKSDVKILKGQFTDVTQMVLKDNKRITKLETEVEDLKGSIH